MSLCLPASLVLHVARAGCSCGKPKRQLNARGLDAPLLDHLIDADEVRAHGCTAAGACT